jgi:hypothetical protein
MKLDFLASGDFERAFRKGFWRKVASWLTGENIELLPFDEVRNHIPLIGQHYLGLHQVPIDQIVGSVGRYRDFDRAFLPRQKRTKDRWVNIDKAHYQELILPPVDLMKMGEVYFVRDGNHRVSVARERGQEYIDAYVTEIDIPVPLTADLDLRDLDFKREYAEFLEKTGLLKIRPDASIDLTLPGEYERLLEHISVHRWYLGEHSGGEVDWSEAVASWYDNVYTPLVSTILKEDILQHFSGRTEGDLYLWVIEYQWYLRAAYKDVFSIQEAARQFQDDCAEWPTSRLVSLLQKASWVDNLILEQEKADFLKRTRIDQLRPQANITLTVPGLYETIIEHISVHRWYLGEKLGREALFDEAVVSWYDNVYLPLVKLIQDQKMLVDFHGRTETDLYLWIIEHQGYLKEAYGGEIPIDVAAERFAEDAQPERRSRRKKK